MKGFPQMLENNGSYFLGSGRDYAGSRAVLFGAPMDYSSSFRPGSRMAPRAIREISPALEEFSLYLEKDLGEVNFFDGGDLELPPGNTARGLEIIQEACRLLYSQGKVPLMLGGEHLVTLPAVKAAAGHYPSLALLQLDAHADLRPCYLGEEYTHASVIYRVIRELPPRDIYQLGIRSGTREELRLARRHTRFYPGRVVAPLKEILGELAGRPVYVTLDIDVVDPAFAPGTGTPEPGGCSSQEILEATYLLGQLDLVGFDLVEVSPAYDPSGITSLLAARILREIILQLG